MRNATVGRFLGGLAAHVVRAVVERRGVAAMATGLRMMVGLLREIERRSGRYGLETMCVNGGQGAAAIFERM